MARIKGVPLDARRRPTSWPNVWVDHTLFAQALASGRDLADSATAAQVLWPEMAELGGTRWHDTLMARRDSG